MAPNSSIERHRIAFGNKAVMTTHPIEPQQPPVPEGRPLAPDARQDLAGAINYLIARVEYLESEREQTRMLPKTAARALGFSDNYFSGRPWRIPGFGLNGRMFPLSTWREWTARPEAERMAGWDLMSAAERRRIIRATRKEAVA